MFNNRRHKSIALVIAEVKKSGVPCNFNLFFSKFESYAQANHKSNAMLTSVYSVNI